MKKRKLITTCVAFALSCVVSASNMTPHAFAVNAEGFNNEVADTVNAESTNVDVIATNESIDSLPDISSDITPKIYEDVSTIFENANNYDPTTPLNFAPEPLQDIYSATNSTFDISKDYLTPQQFGANGNDKQDDTDAFRALFAAAYQGTANRPNLAGVWNRCKPIYIPSGTYYIDGPIVDEDLTTTDDNNNKIKVRKAMFEVFGAGRESTQIMLTGDILFNNQITASSDNSVVFGFSTFHDIGFVGNQENTFMFMASSNDNPPSDGVQRLQFLSCGFSHFHKILECKDYAKQMLSEITFSYCKINDCGLRNKADDTATIPCQLFTLTCPQAVNWRFDYTDIESIYGDIFHFKGASSICLNGGSVIIKRGAVFNFDYYDKDQHESSSGNCPQVFCNGTRFEVWNDASLLKAYADCQKYPSVTFRSCNLNSTSIDEEHGRPATPNLIEIHGCVDALFDDCFGCSNIKISGSMPKDSNVMHLPKLTFRDCSDLNVDFMVQNSSWEGVYDKSHYNDTNNVRIIVDDSYDFYLYDHSYVHTIFGLNECRQQVNLSAKGYNAFDLENGKTFTANPYGYVKYVELTVPKQNISGEATLRLYNRVDGTRKQIGEDINITFDSNRTHMIIIQDYVEKLEAEFSWPSTKIGTCMNMTIVKY